MILSRSKLTEFLGIGVIILFPITTALYIIFPLDIAGKNAYLFFVYISLVTIILINYRLILNNQFTVLTSCLLIMSCSVLVIRTIVFDQNLTEIFENRIIITLPLFLIVAYCIGEIESSKTKKSFLLLISVVAILGIIRSFFFPTVFIGEGVEKGVVKILDEGATVREFSILGSANLYGILICMGLYIIGYKNLVSSNKVLYLSLFAILFVAVFLSDSRFPAFLSILFFVMTFLKRNLRWYQLVFIITVPVIFSLLVLDNFYGVIDRFADSDHDVRFIKAQLSLELLSQSLETIMIGVSFPEVADASFGLITISDNSVLAVGMASGIFIMLSHVLLVSYLIWKAQDRVAVTLLSMTFLLYNAIYWDVFVFYISLIYIWYARKKQNKYSEKYIPIKKKTRFRMRNNYI